MTRDFFTADGNSVHEADINKAAEAGLTRGRTNTLYAPLDPVRRDQMGSFVTRMLEVFVDASRATPPGAG